MSKEKFKLFVKEHPRLLRYINDESMTWQKFYEIYDMYGDDLTVWSKYLNDSDNKKISFADFLDNFKNINLDNIQESIKSIERVLSVIGDITGSKTVNTSNYEPKPIYKHFDD